MIGRCQQYGCVALPDASWTFCDEHLAEREARMLAHGPQSTDSEQS